MSATAAPSYRWLFWCLAILGLTVDQGSKYLMFAWLHDEPRYTWELIPGAFSFYARYSHERDPGNDWRSPLRTISSDELPEVNHGALWGIGGGGEEGETHFNAVFAMVSVIAAIAIVLWSFRAATAHDRVLCMALGLILAGTLGNFYDRVIFDGVRDFLRYSYGFNFPVFNVADSCLVCGAGLLLLQAFFTEPAKEKPAETAAVAETQQAGTVMPS